MSGRKRFFDDRNTAPVVRFGLGVTLLALIPLSQINQRQPETRVGRRHGCFEYGECAFISRFGLAASALCTIQGRQIVGLRFRHGHTLRPWCFLEDRQLAQVVYKQMRCALRGGAVDQFWVAG